MCNVTPIIIISIDDSWSRHTSQPSQSQHLPQLVVMTSQPLEGKSTEGISRIKGEKCAQGEMHEIRWNTAMWCGELRMWISSYSIQWPGGACLVYCWYCERFRAGMDSDRDKRQRRIAQEFKVSLLYLCHFITTHGHEFWTWKSNQCSIPLCRSFHPSLVREWVPSLVRPNSILCLFCWIQNYE